MAACKEAAVFVLLPSEDMLQMSSVIIILIKEKMFLLFLVLFSAPLTEGQL